MNRFTSEGKYNQIKPSKSSILSEVQFNQTSVNTYQVQINLKGKKPIFIGLYLSDYKAFVTKKNENQYQRNSNSFAFNYELVNQSIFPIDYFKINYIGETIESAGLSNSKFYYICKSHLLRIGFVQKYQNSELQIFAPISEFSETLDFAKERASIQLEIF